MSQPLCLWVLCLLLPWTDDNSQPHLRVITLEYMPLNNYRWPLTKRWIIKNHNHISSNYKQCRHSRGLCLAVRSLNTKVIIGKLHGALIASERDLTCTTPLSKQFKVIKCSLSPVYVYTTHIHKSHYPSSWGRGGRGSHRVWYCSDHRAKDLTWMPLSVSGRRL